MFQEHMPEPNQDEIPTESYDEQQMEDIRTPEDSVATAKAEDREHFEQVKDEAGEALIDAMADDPEAVEAVIDAMAEANAVADTPLSDDEKANIKREFSVLQGMEDMPPGSIAEMAKKIAKEGEVSMLGSLWRISTPGMIAEHVGSQLVDMKRFATGEDRDMKAAARIAARFVIPPGASTAVSEMFLRDEAARADYVRTVVKDAQNGMTVLAIISPLAGPEAVPIAGVAKVAADKLGDEVIKLVDQDEPVTRQDVIKAIHRGSGMDDPKVREAVFKVAAQKLGDKEFVGAATSNEDVAKLLGHAGRIMQENPQKVDQIYTKWIMDEPQPQSQPEAMAA
ncbi:MAG: hypothetical protein Q8P90_02135 [bacterium]|nr:hypothetical protein [bacterium]